MTPARRLVEPAAIAVLAFLFTLPLHDKGLVMGEEGQILAEAEKILSGSVLYRDIEGFVAPGVWYVTAAILALTDGTLNATRIASALLFAATAALLYVLCGSVASRRWALAAFVFYMAHRVLVFPIGTFLFYTEFAIFFTLCTVAALLRDRRQPSTGALVAAGVGLALTFLFKQNVGGILVLGVAAWALAFRRDPKALVAIYAPAAAGVLVAVAYFAAHGALGAFVDSIVREPLRLDRGLPTFGVPYLKAFLPFEGPLPHFIYAPTLFSEEFLFPRRPGWTAPLTIVVRAVSALVYGAFPLLVLTLGWRAVRGRLGDVDWLLAAGGAATFASAVPRSDFAHVAQGIVGCVPLAVRLLHSSRLPRLAARVSFGAVGLAFGLAVILLLNLPYDHRLQNPKADVYLPRRAFESIRRTLAWIDRDVPPDAPMAVIPGDVLYYFLSDRPIPNRFSAVLPHAVAHDGGRTIAHLLDVLEIDHVVYTEAKLPGWPDFEVYASALHAHLEENFETLREKQTKRWAGPRLLRRRGYGGDPRRSGGHLGPPR